MPQEMLFGKYKGQSVEQIALRDYDYFNYILKQGIKAYPLRTRFEFVDHVVNNFLSQEGCAVCDEPAEFMSAYHGPYGDPHTSLGFIYCSHECVRNHDQFTDQPHKTKILPIKFKSVYNYKQKQYHKEIIDLCTRCMGIKEGRKTKRYLEEFFDNMELRVPFR